MITVVKCGGQVLDDASLFKSFCRDFAALEGPKVLVHGGGALAGKVQKALGMEPVKYEGRRVTDDATLQVVTMVYAGWCNKQMVALLQSFGCNAVGLAGCDGSVITAAKRPPKALSDGRVVDFGWVGDVTPDSVNADFLRQLLDAGYTPVLCAINHDGAGQLLNTNADTVASSVAAGGRGPRGGPRDLLRTARRAGGPERSFQRDPFHRQGLICIPEGARCRRRRDDSQIGPGLRRAGKRSVRGPDLSQFGPAEGRWNIDQIINGTGKRPDPGGLEFRL